MLGKVLKKSGKKAKKRSSHVKKDVQVSQTKGRKGFHAKANSSVGAARQRSIGNRMSKPPR